MDGGAHMPVIWGRQFDGRDQMFEARHQAVPGMGVHQCAGACQPFPQIGAQREQVTRPFVDE